MDGVGGWWIVGNGRSRLAIRLDGLVLLADFLVSLAQQALDEVIVLIRCEQFFHRGLVVLPVKPHVAAEIREKLRLLWNGAFVEDGFGGSDVVLRLGEVSAARREAGLRVLPAKVPQIDASRLDVGFFQSRVVTNLVPMEGRIQVAGVDANPSGFVGNFSLLEQIPHGEIEDFLLEFDGFLAVPIQKRKTWPWPARRRIFARASRQRRWLFESICARLGLFPSNPARLRQRCWPAPKPARIRESADRAPEHLPGFLPASIADPA